MTNDSDFFQQYLGDLNAQAQNASAQPAASADPGTLSAHSSQGQRPTNEICQAQGPSGTAQQSGEAQGQSTGPSGDSEAGASPHVGEGLQQDTGNSDSKTATTEHKHAAKLRSQDLQEKNRKAQRRFRERQKVCSSCQRVDTSRRGSRSRPYSRLGLHPTEVALPEACHLSFPLIQHRHCITCHALSTCHQILHDSA